MARQIVLDTETTGLEISQGHRIIEIGAVELVNRKLSGNYRHYFVNPQREIDKGAHRVHGLDAEQLKDKSLFADIIDEFIGFISGAELLIHNAPFDVGFLNYEIDLLLQNGERDDLHKLEYYCDVLDTLQIARQLHPGRRNSLDALCVRYNIDNSARTYHGALLDAEILVEVYLAMTGGQTDFEFEFRAKEADQIVDESISVNPSFVLRASEQEIEKHETFLQMLDQKSNGNCLWLKNRKESTH